MGRGSDWPETGDTWTASVSFPVEHIGRIHALHDKVDELAERFGGRGAGSSVPVPESMGLPGFETFGFAVDFEAYDANVGSFLRAAARDFHSLGARAECEGYAANEARLDAEAELERQEREAALSVQESGPGRINALGSEPSPDLDKRGRCEATVSFPVKEMQDRDELLARVEQVADVFGGRMDHFPASPEPDALRFSVGVLFEQSGSRDGFLAASHIEFREAGGVAYASDQPGAERAAHLTASRNINDLMRKHHGIEPEEPGLSMPQIDPSFELEDEPHEIDQAQAASAETPHIPGLEPKRPPEQLAIPGVDAALEQWRSTAQAKRRLEYDAW